MELNEDFIFHPLYQRPTNISLSPGETAQSPCVLATAIYTSFLYQLGQEMTADLRRSCLAYLNAMFQDLKGTPRLFPEMLRYYFDICPTIAPLKDALLTCYIAFIQPS